MKFFLIGIKGSGMSALANILLDDGYQIRGCDTSNFVNTEVNLNRRNVIIDSFEEKEFLNSDLIIIGHSFYNEKLINLLNQNSKAYFEYNEFLDLYLDSNKLVCISGSHGKTTLVKMLSNSFPSCSYLCGEGQGKKRENDNFFFLEACEYKRHFLKYHPQEIFITNIDYDHVDYFKTESDYINSFNEFASLSKKVYCLYQYRNLISHSNVITYGLDKDADYHIEYLDQNGGFLVSFYHKNELIHKFSIDRKPDHYLELLCANLAFYHQHNYDLDVILNNLKGFSLPFQRFNFETFSNQVIVKDYCHHPTQINYNLEQCNLYYKNYKKVAIFRPDRTSRLVFFKDKFISELEKYDYAFVLPLSHTEEINGHSSKELETNKIHFVDKINDISKFLNFKEKFVFSFMSSKDLSDDIFSLKHILNN